MSEDEQLTFKGFNTPDENWSKLPNELVESLHLFSSLAELKVVIYILRHTWGYREYETDKRITTDEFMYGRKRKDGSRIDPGVGMHDQAVREGLKRAEEHGFILVTTDETDKARVKKSYALHMSISENHSSGGGKSLIGTRKITDRSETDTLGKITKKDLDAQFDAIAATFKTTASGYIVNLRGMIFGSTKVRGEWEKHQIKPPATLDEFQGFAPYMQERMRLKNLTDIPSAAVTIERWYCDYREGLKQESAAASSHIPPSLMKMRSPWRQNEAEFQEWLKNNPQEEE